MHVSIETMFDFLVQVQKGYRKPVCAFTQLGRLCKTPHELAVSLQHRQF